MITDCRFPTCSEPDHLPDQSGGTVAVPGCRELQRPPGCRTPAALADPSGGSRHEPAQTAARRQILRRPVQLPPAFNAHNPGGRGAV
jgi:hypothetical protein